MLGQFCKVRLFEFNELVNHQTAFMLSLWVIHFAFAPVTVLSNLLITRASVKASSIPFTLKSLFVSLAVSDLAVGILVQPMFSGIILALLKKTDSDGFTCPALLTTFLYLSYFLGGSSFLSITAISLDRLLALSLHLRYRALVTTRRVVFSTLVLWIISALSAWLFISLPRHNDIVAVLVEFAGLLATTFAYFNINRIARHHRNRIQSQHQFQNGHGAELVQVKKSAFNTVYVYFVFLGCYIPFLCTIIAKQAHGFDVSVLVLHFSSISIILFNSMINPLIYCWRYREIRENAKNTLKTIFLIHAEN